MIDGSKIILDLGLFGDMIPVRYLWGINYYPANEKIYGKI